VVDNKDKQQVPILQQQLLTTVGLIEECMVNGFPFEVPLPRASLHASRLAQRPGFARFERPVSWGAVCCICVTGSPHDSLSPNISGNERVCGRAGAGAVRQHAASEGPRHD
jgi:hypothetical protein